MNPRKKKPLAVFFTPDMTEAGCDEAGRGCLAGPVFAAAVILPKNFYDDLLNDSKVLTARQRNDLRPVIQEKAIAWSVAKVDAGEIDEINILQASFLAMHRAVDSLMVKPQLLLIDGNRFNTYPGIPHQCFIKGDGRFLSIAAASVLAKTYRDDFMLEMDKEYPDYGWKQNKGYPTKSHREGIAKFGTTPLHRLSYNLLGQLRLEL
jgi:ribonuclease HII